VRVAPDPVTKQPGIRASCSPRGAGELRNPWRCTIDYRSGRVISYTVTLAASGAYTGTDELLSYQGHTTPMSGEITGCCVAIP